jgi:hypothetical protein
VDDKPVIIEQIQEALSQTPWKSRNERARPRWIDAQQPPDALC